MKDTVLYGVGIGPGAPDLITLRALRILREVPVVFTPSKDGEDTIAGSVVEEAVGRKEFISLSFPMTGKRDTRERARRVCAERIVETLRRTHRGAFVSLGDPLFYSTFSHVLPFVKEYMPECRIEVVPGVSSMNAVSSLLCTPLAEADERIAVVPALHGTEGLKYALERFDTVVIMKLGRVLDEVLDVLCERGLTERAVFVSRAGWKDERIVRDVVSLKGTDVDYMSMIIVTRCRRR